MFELKSLSPEAVPAALAKAHRYRLLNEAQEAESICRDVLEVEPGNQEALVTLLLALTDQFQEHLHPTADHAREVLARLGDEYGRAYYGGILCERQAKAQWRRGGMHAGHIAYAGFREAMVHFEKAAALRPPGNDDPLLRWNTCARLLMAHRELTPAPQDPVEQWLE